MLLIILLFNWAGYSFFIDYLEGKANTTLEWQLDENNYNAAQLISVKIPVTQLAYYTNSALYQRKYGQIAIKDTVWNYVKLRIYNDTLEVLCIPNPEVIRLRSAKNDFFKLANDLQHEGKNANPSAGIVKYLLVYYYAEDGYFKLRPPDVLALKRNTYSSPELPFHFSAVILKTRPTIAGYPAIILSKKNLFY